MLDPTCGSGAFLFAALGILEPLYEACLDRMAFFLAEWGEAGRKQHPNYAKRFDQVLRSIVQHPSREYFVLRSIVVSNLFGVDLMDEAVEICKLRLFLKLVAEVDTLAEVEPLPDIDFNIQAGNALVGFATMDHLIEAQTTVGLRSLDEIKEGAEKLALAARAFREQQTTHGGEVAPEHKRTLREGLVALADDLDLYLAAAYGVDARTEGELKQWKAGHKPFHWLTEFYSIIDAGGLDVVIGNPPYVAYKPGELGYTVRDLKTAASGNLWGFCVERSLALLRDGGRTGMIVQLSLTFSRDFASVRQLLLDAGGYLRVSSFDNIPDKLFTGEKQSTNTSTQNQQRVTILVLHKQRVPDPRLEMAPLVRWRASERHRLFWELPHTDVRRLSSAAGFPKVGRPDLATFLARW